MTSPSSSTKPPKKVLFAPSSPEEKVLYTRFCKKGKECERGTECVFAHSYEQLNPVLCAHERTKAGCTRKVECLFMHTTENKYTYVLRACQDDLVRLGIDISTICDENSPSPVLKIGLSSKTTENAAKQIKSAYAELCEKTKHFKESWADIDEEERKYQVADAEIRMDPEFTSMDDYSARTMYRLWGDGTLQANRGDGVFLTIEKNGQNIRNVYDVLGSVSPRDEDYEPSSRDEENEKDNQPKKSKQKRKPYRKQSKSRTNKIDS